MDRRQRLGDLSATFALGMKSHQTTIWTCLPGIVQSVNLGALTCTVQPAIQGVLSNPKTGAASNVNLPLLVDCPIIYPSGGGCTLTFPIAHGDECLVFFASRCIDAWWQNGGVQPPMTYRMHDLSDGFVMVGPRSQANLISGVSTSTTQLRSNDGSTYVEINSAGQIVNIVAPGGVNITGPLTVNGTTNLIGAVNLGATGGPAVARVGDTVSGGVITSGSSDVSAS